MLSLRHALFFFFFLAVDLPDLVGGPEQVLESPVSDDGTIEENFEAELGGGADEDLATKAVDFSDIASSGVVDIVGDDTCGRKIVVVSACHLPNNKDFNHNKFLK